MIGVFGLNYHCNPMEALDISLSNLTLLNAVIPNYGDKGEEVINADDPSNNDKINQLLGF